MKVFGDLWQSRAMHVVVATTETGLGKVEECIHDHGPHPTMVLTPSDLRRLVIATVDDDTEATRLAALLQEHGHMAVTRPDGGARFDGWMQHTQPVTFGGRLSVCFAWSEHDRAGLPGLIEVGLGGFGNGRHPTTGLVIDELLTRIKGGERVLDLGCGSGVLGLAALELGASSVVAVDNQTHAIEATRRNAELNGRHRQLTATLSPLAEIAGTFDVIVANVGRSVLVELAPQLVARLAPGGWLAASGISPRQCSLVAGFLRPLVEVGHRDEGEWSVLVLANP